MPVRRSSARRKNSSSAAATDAIEHYELPTPGVETAAEIADAVVVKVEEEKDAEMLVQAEVSDPNPAEIDGDSTKGVPFSSQAMISEEVFLENFALDDMNVVYNENGEPDGNNVKVKEDLRQGSEDVDEGKQGLGVGVNQDGVVCIENNEPDESRHKENEDLWQGSENVDAEKQGVGAGKDKDGVVCIDGLQSNKVTETNLAQEETATVKIDDFKVLHDSNTPLVVKDDGDGEGEEIAEVITAQESNMTKASCENDAVLVVKDGGDGARKGTAEIISTKESAQAVSTKTSCENNTAIAVKDDSKENRDDEESDNNSEGDEEDNEGDEDPSVVVQDPLTDNKKDKDIEIYVGRLDKNTVEDDLANVFQQFGELKSTRIVRNSTTKKSKGFAFVRFATADQARHALSALKDGVEVRGKHVKISASQDNDTLYLGNICKTWKKEDVLQQLDHYGIKHLEMIRLPDDPKIDGKIKGFAFLEFSTHSDAVAAFQRLRKPDAVFGRDVSAKVAFAQTPMHPGDHVLSQVKRVYVEGLNEAWNEEKVKEICKQYGEIVKINLCQSSGNKHKDFGFVTFTSHENAVACVEGINNAAIGGDIKVKASIAKPQYKSRLQKQGFCGGFKVEKQSEASLPNKEGEISKGSEPSTMKSGLNSQQSKKKRKESSIHKIKASIAKPQQKGSLKKQNSRGEFKVEKHNKLPLLEKEGENSKEAELSKMKGDLTSQQTKRKRKRKASPKQDLKAPPELGHGDQGIPKRSKKGNEIQNSSITPKAGNRKRKKASNHEGREEGSNRNTHGKKPLKKQKGNMQRKERDNSRNRKSDSRIRKGHDDYRNSTRRIDPYVPKYAAPGAYHLGPDSMSTSTRRNKEMEPHAGYIEPASAKQGRSYSGYVQPVVRTHSQHQSIYLEPAAGGQSQLPPRYLDRSVMIPSQRGYFETAVGAEIQSYGGYRPSAIVQIPHDTYDPGLVRAVRHDGGGTSGLAYVGGPPLPASQVQSHTSYAGYRVASSYSGAYSTQRTYY